MTALDDEQYRHDQQARLDELEELGIGRRPCEHVTTDIADGTRCVLCGETVDVEVAS